MLMMYTTYPPMTTPVLKGRVSDMRNSSLLTLSTLTFITVPNLALDLTAAMEPQGSTDDCTQGKSSAPYAGSTMIRL